MAITRLLLNGSLLAADLPYREDWTANNYLIVRWIKQTTKPKIRSSISTREIAKELWDIHQNSVTLTTIVVSQAFEIFLLLYFEDCSISYVLPHMSLSEGIRRSRRST